MVPEVVASTRKPSRFCRPLKQQEEADAPEMYEGKKVEPESKIQYTWEELKVKYAKEFNEDELQKYWKKEMKWVEE